MSYSNIPTPPSSNEDSPQPVYFVASPNSNSFTSPEMSVQPLFNSAPQFSYNTNIMDTTTDSNEPFLRFIEEPTDKFRFRYKSEMAGTHGSLTGMNSDKSRKQTYPTVELVNFTQKAVIRCSIYQTNHGERDCMPHAHRLIMKRGKDEFDDPHDLSVGPEEGFVASFHSMGIIHTAKKNIVSELIRKKTKLKKEYIARMEGTPRELTIKENLDIKGLAESESKSINLNIVCLRFDAFIVDKGIYYPICRPIYSHGINNLKSALTGELKIVRMDHCTSPAKGGLEVFVLVERVTKKNIKIRFYELDDDQQEVWEDWGKFRDLDVHHQYAIVFKTPKYRDEKITGQVNVFMELVRPSDGARSEPKGFTYTASDDFKPGNKRPRTSSYSFSSYNSSSISSSELPATINNVNPQPYDNSWHNIPLLNSEEMNRLLAVASNDINSEEFQMIYGPCENEYDQSVAKDAPNQFVGQGGDSGLGKTAITESHLQGLKAIHLSNRQYAPVTRPHSRKVSSASYSRVIRNMERSQDDINIAQRTYNEFRSFLKTKHTPAKTMEMLEHYLGEDRKTNALHIFIGQNQVDEATFLLKVICKHGRCDFVNVKNSDHLTPLHIATLCNNENIVKYLLVCKADLSSQDPNGNTALHIAVNERVSLEVLEMLLSAEKSTDYIDMEDDEGNTPLMNAIERKNFEAIKLLCRKGANINQHHKKNGFTPLRIAIEKQSVDVVKFILDHPGLKFDEQDDFGGISPFKAAYLKGVSEDIIACIQRYMENKHIKIDFKQEVEDDSDVEMDEDEFETKTPLIPADQLEDMYKDVTKFTPQCLETVSALLDRSGKWEDLADLLDLGHIIRSGVIPMDQRVSKNLLKFAVERNNDKILEIRNFLENLDEIEAVEAIDKMVRAANV